MIRTDHSYECIRDDVRGRVQAGEFSETGKLPGERLLARHYGVSHLTMNKALSMLVQEGLLDRRSNRGTYVCPRAAAQRCLLHIPAEGHVFHELATTLIRALQKEHFTTTLADISQRPPAETTPAAPYDLAVLDVLNYSPLVLMETYPAWHYAFFTRYCAPIDLPGLYVTTDYTRGGSEAAARLAGWGCRRLAALCQPIRPYGVVTQYLKGVEQRAADGSFRLVAVIEQAGDECPPELRDLLRGGAVDGILANADYLLIPAIKFMDDRRIPRDSVRMIGYYNTPWSESYHFSSFDLCIPRLVDALVEQVRAQCFDRRILVEPRFIERN